MTETGAGNGPEKARRVLKHVERYLVCELTADEIEARGRAVGIAAGKLRDEERRFEGEKKAHKTRQDSLEAEVLRLHYALESGTESRPVRCEEIVNEAADRVDIVRTDTGDVVDHRPITMKERQHEMPFDTETEAASVPAAEPEKPQKPKRGRKAKPAAERASAY